MQAIRSVKIARGVVIGGKLPVLIMGPCVIESERHALRMAKLVQAAAKRVGFPVIFKASYDKANRTSHTSFRGQGLEEGLRILQRIKDATGLPVTTDVHDASQVAAVAATVDLIQVPALLCRQTDLIEACARSGKPTSIKKGQFLAPQDCGNIVAKFEAIAGQKKLVLIERGTSFGYNTLVSDFRSLPIMRSFGVPVVFDGTHSVQAPGGLGTKSGGAGHFAPVLMRAAMAVGVEGVFLETHDDRLLVDGHDGGGIDEVAEQVLRFCRLVAVADAIRQHAVEAARHDRQLNVAVDFECDGTRQGIHVKKIDAVLDAVFDEHALGVAADELHGRTFELIGDQQRRILVTEIGDDELTQRAVIVRQVNDLIQDSRRAIRSARCLQLDASPGGKRLLGDLLQQ